MTDRDSKPPRLHFTAGTISVLITIVTMGAGLVAQFIELKEARRYSEVRDTAHDSEITTLKKQVRDLENDRALEGKINELTVAVARLETKLSTLSSDMRRRER